MCCLGVIVKYILIIANVIFAIAGLAIIGLGTAVHIYLQDLYELFPANLNVLSISIIVLGCIVFIIAFLACCGAFRESRCMLLTYAVLMAILAGIKIYLAVIVFRFLDSAQSTINRWLVSSLNNENLRPAYHVMETLFSCCGTTGADSYTGIYPVIPPTCCANPVNQQCTAQDSYDGCSTVVGDFFESFGEGIGAVFVVVIIIEIICVLSGVCVSLQIRQKRYA